MYARYAHRQPYATFRSGGPKLVYLRPDIDANNSGWTDQANSTTNLYQVVDELTASDADYVRSSQNPTSDIIRFRLSDPAKNIIEPFRLRYRCGATAPGTLRTGLSAFWEMDEVGGNRYDSVAGLVLTDLNTVTYAPGIGGINNAAKFTSANLECFSAPMSSAVDMSNTDWTLAMWLYLDTMAANVCSAAVFGATPSWRLIFSDKYYFQIFDSISGAPTTSTYTYGAPVTNTWTFVVGRLDVTHGLIKISVNGGVNDTAACSTYTRPSGDTFYIGAQNGSDYHVNGRIDRVGLWKRALTDIEVAQLYNNGVGLSYAEMGTGSLNLTTRLKQGTTQIASWSDGLSDSFKTVERILTSGQFAAITDFNNLFVEFEASGALFPTLPNLVARYMADTVSTSPVTAVNDQSGAGNHLINNGTVTWTATSAYNGKPAFIFTAANDAALKTITAPSATVVLSPTNRLSIFVVGRMNSASSNYARAVSIGMGGSQDYQVPGNIAALTRASGTNAIETYGGGPTVIDTNMSAGVNHRFGLVVDGTNMSHYIDNVVGSQAAFSMSLSSPTNFVIGNQWKGTGSDPPPSTSYQGAAWDGPILEVVICSAALDVTQRNALDAYFVAKYGAGPLFDGALLHLDGTNGSTSISDSSGNSHAFTLTGTAVLDTSQTKFGASSVSTGSGGQINGDGLLSFGTGDYTVDFWFKENGTPAAQINILLFGNVPTNDTIVYIPFADTIRVFNRNTGTNVITGTTAPSPNNWHHVALTRASTVTRLFLNGVQEGSNWNDTKNYVDGSTEPSFGAGLVGWIDEVRCIRGTAMWTANFTPPTAPY
jgi:hypothetical protein